MTPSGPSGPGTASFQRYAPAPMPTGRTGSRSASGSRPGQRWSGRLWSGATLGYGAVGEVVEAAAALQSAAKAGSVLVGPATKVATEGIFVWGATEDVSPNPDAKPLVATYLERPKARRAGSAGPARAAGPAPAWSAARQKCSALDEALREATSGTGSVVFVVGEPGLGKTRLVQECRKRFMAWVGAGTGRLPLWLEGRCASYASSTPYGLYQQLLSAWAGVALEEGEEVVRPALERAMKAVFGGEVEHTAFLAHMMGLRAGPEGARLARLSPEGLQRATFAAVGAVMARLAATGPTVLVLEDLHWADPTSLRLTEELAALARDAPLLLLATRRPEPDPGVSALESALEASSPVPVPKSGARTPRSTTPNSSWPGQWWGEGASHDVIGTVRTNVDGNPLFLEERFSSLVETGALVKDETSWSISGSVTVEVPEALERLIRSRVDRLAPLPRETFVAASVLGPEFSHSALLRRHRNERESHRWRWASCAGPACSARSASCPSPSTASATPSSRRRPIAACSTANVERSMPGPPGAWRRPRPSAWRRWRRCWAITTAMAGEAERAVHHLEVAARHAAAHFAIDEAVTSYRSALEVVDQHRAGPAMAKGGVDLRYQVGRGPLA